MIGKIFNIFRKDKETKMEIQEKRGTEMVESDNGLVQQRMVEQPKKGKKIANDIITKDTTIGDIVQKYPETVEILLGKGVHCVGCHVAYWETLEQGFKGHGMSDKEINQTIKELNRAILQEDSGKEDIVLTKRAISRIKKLTKNKDYGLRINVISGGCSGHQYNLEIGKRGNKDDVIIEESGVKIFTDKETMGFIKGSKIDYLDTLQGAGFKISNPNVTRTCGCGQSFGV